MDRRWLLGGGLAAVIVALGVLGSCTVLGADGGDAAPTTTTLAVAEARPDADQVAGLADPSSTIDEVAEATTTSVPAGGKSSEAGSDPVGDLPTPPKVGTPATSGNCVAIERVVLPRATVITIEDFEAPEERPTPTGRATIDEVRLVANLVPAEHRESWQRALDAIDVAGGSTGEPVRGPLTEARNAVEGWARQTCPQAPPSWRCDEFGTTTEDVLDLEPEKGSGARPEMVLAQMDDADGAVELDRTEAVVLYGWLDDEGFVVRTFQVGRDGDGWAYAGYHSCL